MRVKWRTGWNSDMREDRFAFGRVLQFIYAGHQVQAVVLRDNPLDGDYLGARFASVNISDLRVDPPNRL